MSGGKPQTPQRQDLKNSNVLLESSALRACEKKVSVPNMSSRSGFWQNRKYRGLTDVIV